MVTAEELTYSIRVTQEDGSTVAVPFDSDPVGLSAAEWKALSELDPSVLPALTDEQALACMVIYQRLLRYAETPWAEFGPFIARLFLGDESVIEVI